MKEHDKSEPLCRSVFKSGGNTVTKTQFTEKWIELVNRLENSKENSRENSAIRP